jgi:hypothetical protein
MDTFFPLRSVKVLIPDLSGATACNGVGLLKYYYPCQNIDVAMVLMRSPGIQHHDAFFTFTAAGAMVLLRNAETSATPLTAVSISSLVLKGPTEKRIVPRGTVPRC